VSRAGFLLALATMALAPVPARAQDDAGTAAAVVLQLAPSPRPLALGEAYAALPADELSLFYNPARLAAALPAVGLAYQTLPAGAAAGSLATAAGFGPGVVGVGIQYLSYGEIDVIEPDPSRGGEYGRPTGERVGGGEVAIGAGYGLRLAAGLQLGAALKVLRLQLAEADAAGLAFDLGAGLELLGGRATLGIAAQNLGGEIGPGRPSPLPRRIRGGVGLRLGDSGGPRVGIALEGHAIGDRVVFASGLEATVVAPGGLALVGRVGYHPTIEGDARGPVVFGAGLSLDRFEVDYAFRDLGPLGGAHLFGISIPFAR